MAGEAATDTDSGWVAVPPMASVATTVKVEVPLVVGVPAISPVLGLMLRPSGSDPPVTDQVYGVVPPDTRGTTS